MSSTPALQQELRQNPLFAGLTETQLSQVMDSMHVTQLAEGERLFDRGQPAQQFFLVRRGQIKLYLISFEGTEKVIDIIPPGETFAEAIMFMERQAYPVNAEALAPSEVIGFDNAAFLAVLRQSVDTCFRVMAELSKRLKRRLAEIDALTLQNATLRFASFLLQQLPEGCRGPTEIQLPAPKYVIASQLSVKPESLSRIFHRLHKTGLISVEGKTILVHDPERLRALAT